MQIVETFGIETRWIVRARVQTDRSRNKLHNCGSEGTKHIKSIRHSIRRSVSGEGQHGQSCLILGLLRCL